MKFSRLLLTERFRAEGSRSKRIQRSRLRLESMVIVLGIVVTGCSIEHVPELDVVAGSNHCTADRECGSGYCDQDLKACVAEQGDFDGVIFEIVPPTSVVGYGGLTFFKTEVGLAKSSTDLNLVVTPPTRVTGMLLATEPSKRIDCAGAGATTIAATITFTPVETVLGLNVVNYKATTRESNGEQRFDLSLPGGRYDVYVEPILDPSEAVSGACVAVPQLRRGIDIEGERLDLTLKQAAPTSLDVALLSQARFDGWVTDLIHPVTGQLLSTQAALELYQPQIGRVEYRAALRHSVVTGADYAEAGQELLRMTPPKDIVGPTVLMHRAGLEVFTPGQAVISELQPFGPLVDFRAQVVKRNDPKKGIDASVSFTATGLSGVPDGVFTSFEVAANTSPDGQVAAQLLPGEYRVRTIPVPGLGLAASQTTVKVLPIVNSESPDAIQSGHVIAVPQAATLSGKVELPKGVSSLVGAEVHADPTQSIRGCDIEEADAAACTTTYQNILEAALAEDPFTPRQVSGLIGDAASFEITDADCGECEPDKGAVFDLSVRPSAGSRLPWVVKPAVLVDGDKNLEDLALPPAIIHRGRLTAALAAQAQCDAKPELCVLPGALIRAYIVIDDLGAAVATPSTLRSCALVAGENTRDPSERCARSVLQVGEARAADDGSFELVLPAHLD